MSCGFGAVVLVFLIINHRIDDAKEVDRDLLSESRKLDYLISTGEDNLVDLQQHLEDQRRRVDDAQRKLLAVVEHRDRRRAEMQELEASTSAEQQDIEDLQSDVEAREQEVKRLQAQEKTSRATRIREIEGQGDRQYLTGLFVGGDRILIALDISASMLDRAIVQILRRRNMSRQRQLDAPKWQRAQRIAEWLAAQIPLASEYQIALFNTEARFVLPGKTWHKADDAEKLDRALREIAATAPTEGTNLTALADAIATMSPLPDNIFLITDGLPTRSAQAPRATTISGRDRVKLFRDALDQFPKDVPINTILLPLEGDTLASASYWELAIVTGGTFLAPSADWP